MSKVCLGTSGFSCSCASAAPSPCVWGPHRYVVGFEVGAGGEGGSCQGHSHPRLPMPEVAASFGDLRNTWETRAGVLPLLDLNQEG